MFRYQNFPLKSFIRHTKDCCPKITSCKPKPKPLTVEEAFKKYCVIPDVICDVPKSFAKVCFPSGKKAAAGNILTPTEVKDKPTVVWKAEEKYYYFLCMVDPDAPSRENPTFREWNHWMVGNIPGFDVRKGDTLWEFIPSAPPDKTGYHRYVFLIYMQPQKLKFDLTPRLSNKSADGRPCFKISKFERCYSLGKPIAGNFYFAKYDSHVPKVYASLGAK